MVVRSPDQSWTGTRAGGFPVPMPEVSKISMPEPRRARTHVLKNPLKSDLREVGASVANYGYTLYRTLTSIDHFKIPTGSS